MDVVTALGINPNHLLHKWLRKTQMDVVKALAITPEPFQH